MIRTSQRDDGAYYNHGTVYTSVIYIAKSVLELAVLERKLGEQDPFWKDCAERHFYLPKRQSTNWLHHKVISRQRES